MARFTFRLDPLLELRRRTEQEARTILGKAIAKESREREILQRMEEELSESMDLQKRSREGEIWVQGQILALGWNAGRRGEIASQGRRISEAAQVVARARELLMEAKRGVQVLEKLRDRRMEQWKLSERRKEQATLSDIAAIRWARQEREA
ncbi:MAG: flagellar export protein FliJ [Fibrobacteria bacterium]|nr:flagellar export protein FliJ [Fibrobacteria bacterium]